MNNKMTIAFKISTLGLLALLVGCPGKPVHDDKQLIQPVSVEDSRSGHDWINLANQSSGTLRAEYLLNSVAAFIRNNDFVFTDKPMASVFTLPLTDTQIKRWKLYQGILLTHEEKFEQALKLFAEITPDNNEQVFKASDQQLLLLWYSNAYRLSGNFIEAAKKRIALSKLLIIEQQQQKNIDAIWHILNIPTAEYLSLFNQSTLSDRVLVGWIELALINKRYAGQPRELMQAIEVWKSRFSAHPAQQMMPTDLSSISKAQLIHPVKIAVFLPQTGKLAASGKYIRKGIEAAFYKLSEKSDNTIQSQPELKFYNSNVEDIQSLYLQAKNDGMEFIVGPLRKSAITSLIENVNIDIPVLALNMLNKPDNSEIPIYQFGLPVENEARQVAEKFWSKKLNQAAVLVPDTTLGDRALKAFKEQLQRLDGKVTIARHYVSGQDYSKVVRALLAIDDSKKRYQELKKLLGTSIEFEERRRQDIKGIFLFSNAEDGRRLKPLIDYYYAQDLPVFSTSRIYHGASPGRRDRDLNKVYFIDIPWLVSQNKTPSKSSTPQQNIYSKTAIDKEKLKKIWPKTVTGKNARLFAFGFDAFNLIEQLSVLEAFTHQYLKGKTGRLYLNSQKKIARDLPWVQFIKEKIRWIGYLDDQNKEETDRKK